MSPTPTELLAADVGELRESDRHLAAEVTSLTTGVNGLRADFAALKAVSEKEFSHANAFEKRITSVLIAVVLSAGGVIWGAAVLSNEVKHLGIRVDKIESKLDLIIQRLDQMVPKK
jgi:hypothetical protein